MVRPAVQCSVFVYGTLKPGEKYHDRYCGDWLIDHEPAIVPGRLYHLALGYPGLTDEPGWVQGTVLRFHNPEVLVGLDDLEDFTPGGPAPDNRYQREWRQIYHLDQTPLCWAWLYRMERKTVDSLGGIWLPEGVWSGH